jgi:hypothetical protein
MVHKRLSKLDSEVVSVIVRTIERRDDLTPEKKAQMIANVDSDYLKMRNSGWSPQQILAKYSKPKDGSWVPWVMSHPAYGGV